MKKKEEKQETSFRALLPFCYIKTIMSVPAIIIIIITIVLVFVLLFISPMVVWFLKIFQKSIIRALSLFFDLFLKLGLFNLIKLCSSILTKFAHNSSVNKKYYNQTPLYHISLKPLSSFHTKLIRVLGCLEYPS